MVNTPDLNQIKDVFQGSFLTEPLSLQKKLFQVKAYVFDWDGVFNSGIKDAAGTSPFNEMDSAGINMLRFNHYLRENRNPVTAVITGEINTTTFSFAKREHFQGVYYNVKTKKDALMHLCRVHHIEPHDVAWFFDDIPDLAIAEVCGLRVMVNSACKPMLLGLVRKNKLADYITFADGNQSALREAAELLIGLSGRYDDTIMHRVRYSDNYREYMNTRNAFVPGFYTSIDSQIVEQPRP